MSGVFLKAGSCLALITLAAPVWAQDIPSDVRCMLISNVFAKSASDDQAKDLASRILLFFAGRLDARDAAPAITTSIRDESGKIDPKTAAAEMNACRDRMVKATQALQAMAPSPASGR